MSYTPAQKQHDYRIMRNATASVQGRLVATSNLLTQVFDEEGEVRSHTSGSSGKPVPGEKGEKGEKGDRGDRGPKGDKGEKGEKGEKGDRGPKGEKGDSGVSQGGSGSTGARGPQGERGERGPPGLKGEKGDKGDKGDRGERGEPGPKGDRGEKGEKGEKGDSTGIQGPRGEEGPRGPPGDRGPRGLPGEQGPPGKDSAVDSATLENLVTELVYEITSQDLYSFRKMVRRLHYGQGLRPGGVAWYEIDLAGLIPVEIWSKANCVRFENFCTYLISAREVPYFFMRSNDPNDYKMVNEGMLFTGARHPGVYVIPYRPKLSEICLKNGAPEHTKEKIYVYGMGGYKERSVGAYLWMTGLIRFYNVERPQ